MHENTKIIRLALSMKPRQPGGGMASFAQVLIKHLPGHNIRIAGCGIPRRCDALLLFAHRIESPWGWSWPPWIATLCLRWMGWRGVKIFHRIDERLEPEEIELLK